MMKIIKSESDYHATLAEIEALMDRDPAPGTPEADELEHKALLAQAYEAKAFPSSLPDPVEAIKFRMEQQNLSQRDLIPLIGSRNRVSEVLSGKRPLSLAMMRALHSKLGIPAKVLLQDTDPGESEAEEGIEWDRFPLAEMKARGWIAGTSSELRGRGDDALKRFFEPLGAPTKVAALYRRSQHHIRSARKMDEYALVAWSAQVAIQAKSNPPRVEYQSGTVTLDFMRALARLSWSDTGPLLAQEFLQKHGIALVIEPHLSRTYLDGAAILIETDRPVVGMTLRYDRIDNFWYCLMHELAHIALHIDQGIREFFDDLDVEGKGDPREEEADELAGKSLIPDEEWRNSPASRLRSTEAADHLARKLGIHPAIVAGRIRHEFKSFRKLNQLVGHGQVRKHFPSVKWS